MKPCWLIAVLACAVLSESVEGQTRIIDDGAAECEIVVPSDGGGVVVRRAAAEIAKYLKRMSGADVGIVREGEATQSIALHIGPTTVAQRNVPQDLTQHSERFVIQSVPEGVVICGGSDRGTLYGAYRFLEALGCRWLTHNPDDEIVPNLPAIDVPELSVDSRPAFDWRLFKGYQPYLEPWGLKLGMNGFFPPETASKNGMALFLPSQARDVHTFSQLIPASKYFAGHPDWFMNADGQRTKTLADVGGQLCLTAPGLIEEFTSRVREIFDADSNCRVVSITPNDGFGWCKCTRCIELDRRLCGGRATRVDLGRDEPFVGDRLFWFGNEVALRIAESHPDHNLLMLAYLNYVEPPDSVRPVPGLVPFVCHYVPADYSRAISDPSSEANRQFNELLLKWRELSPDMTVYSYVGKSMWWNLPRPILQNFASDIKYFHTLGIRRYFCQSPLSDWALDGPLYYVLTKLLWDPEANPQTLTDEWIKGMFGPAADEMTTFYACVEKSIKKTGRPYSDDPPRQVPGLYDRVELGLALRAIERAEKVSAPENVRARVNRVAQTFRNGYWMIRCLEEDKLGPPPIAKGLFYTGLSVTFMGCMLAFRRKSSARRHGLRSSPSFWLMISIMMMLLIADRALNLRESVIEILRSFVESQDWYRSRNVRRTVLVTIAGVGGVLVVGALILSAFGQLKKNSPALVGVILLSGFFLVRATSFHQADGPSPFHRFDAAFRQSCAGLSSQWIVELTSITTIAASALLTSRRSDIVKPKL